MRNLSAWRECQIRLSVPMKYKNKGAYNGTPIFWKNFKAFSAIAGVVKNTLFCFNAKIRRSKRFLSIAVNMRGSRYFAAR